MKRIFIVSCFAFICLAGLSQAPHYKVWDKCYGGALTEIIKSMQQTTDGGFVLGGWSRSNLDADKTQPNWDATCNTSDYWVVKLDSLGVKQWDKRFGGYNEDQLFCVRQCPDGGYLLGGSSGSDIGGDKSQMRWDVNMNLSDYWVLKIDSVGQKQWDKRYGGTNDDRFASLQLTRDGGYILGGSSISDANGDKTQASWNLSTDYWIVKIDSLGNKQWDRRYGGYGYEGLTSLQQTADGGYILGGYSDSDSTGDKSEAGRGYDDYWIVKIDEVGNKQWDRRFGGTYTDQLTYITQSSDGGYLLGGCSKSDSSGDKTQHMLDLDFPPSDWWIVKTDSVGNKQWDKKFGGIKLEDEFSCISRTNDGNYLLSGTSYSNNGGDKSEDNLGPEQTWIVKIDTLGNKLWDKTIFTDGGLNGLADDEIGLATQIHDGCFVVANYTKGQVAGDKTQPPHDNSNDYWIVKFCDTAPVVPCHLFPPVINANQTVICANDSSNICAPGGYANYIWNTGSAIACISTKLAGSYYVTVTDNTGCSVESNHIIVTVHPLPSVAVSVNGDTLMAYGAVTYQWYLNGNPILDGTSSSYVASVSGNYSVEITDTNFCETISSIITITGIHEPKIQSPGFEIYPNPATNQLFIHTGRRPVGEINIYNTNGSLVVTVKDPVDNTPISIASLANGIYVAEIKTKEGSVRRRWVKM